MSSRQNNNNHSNIVRYPPKPPLKPWCMCSSREGADRRIHSELSIFESTDDSSTLPMNRRLPDPCRCVQKYRRSVARTLTRESYRRSLEDLEYTVEYLLGFLVPMQSVPAKNYSALSNDPKRQSLRDTANFVEDRLRAVQVDLTTLLGSSVNNSNGLGNTLLTRKTILSSVRRIQTKVIRYYLLVHYLLSDLNAQKYEWKFANTALTTAISIYFSCCGDEEDDIIDDNFLGIAEKDEIMCYTALLHMACVIRSREMALPPPSPIDKQCGIISEDGHGMNAMLNLFRKHCNESKWGDPGKQTGFEIPVKNKSSCFLYPKWKWALEVASSADSGNYLRALNLLASDSSPQQIHDESLEAFPSSKPTSLDYNVFYEKGKEEIINDMNLPLSPNTRWMILARCSVAQVLPILRIGMMRQYNKCFGKLEKVSGHDLAQLLYIPTPKSAIEFCQNIGLPDNFSLTQEKGVSDTGSQVPINGDANVVAKVVMKAAPISILGKDKVHAVTNPGRNEDAFVFGSNVDAWTNVQYDLPRNGCRLDNIGSFPPTSMRLQNTTLLKEKRSQKSLANSTQVNNTHSERIGEDEICSDEDDWEKIADEQDINELYWGTLVPRIDNDGVKILPSPVMWELIK